METPVAHPLIPRTIACVVGTRPEAIKMAPVIAAIASEPSLVPLVISTGQHREMLAQALALFGIVADVELDLMQPDQRPVDILSAAIARLSSVLVDTEPAWVVVQGDTTTALAGALAAAYCAIPVAHVEAGLRTGNLAEPFPEELNRKAIGAVTTLHFPPTAGSASNLRNEGVDNRNILVTGNTVIDALKYVAAQDWQPPSGHRLSAIPEEAAVVLVTAHRRENFGQPFADACDAIADLAGALGDAVHVVWPVHPNPAIGPVVRAAIGDRTNVSLLEPLEYHELVWVLSRARLVITDSGGIQEEAPAFGVPVLVMRDVTERPEAVEYGVVKLVGCDRRLIVRDAIELLTDEAAHQAMSEAVNPYGDGLAADRIVGRLAGHPVQPFQPDSTRK